MDGQRKILVKRRKSVESGLSFIGYNEDKNFESFE